MLEYFDIWRFLAGLGTFLFGMSFIELALKNLSGRRFKKFLRQYTNTPIKAILGGTFVTAILQSSSVVSLMVLAFVGAGIIQLKNAIGIIFGSNLGTTLTGWIVATLGFKLDIESFALPMIAIGGITLIMLDKSEKLKETGRFLLGFGFLFLGLDFMKISIGEITEIIDITTFQGLNPYLFFIVGFILTAIIQSSSASMVITLSALNAGIIPIESAAAMVIGSDLGTTITVLIGGIKGTPSKKRVALSHFLFNLITDLIALALLYPLLQLITTYFQFSDPLYTLVFFHTSFNILGILLLLPFIGVFAKFLEKRFVKDDNQLAQHINKVPANVPEAAIEALANETKLLIQHIIYLNLTALRINTGLFSFPDYIKKEEKGVFKPFIYKEKYAAVKQLGGEIIEYHINILNEKLEGNEAGEINQSIHAVRHAMSSVKQVKDILHNIQEFENSSNDAKRSLYEFIKGQLNEFHLSLHNVFQSSQPAIYFEELTDLLQENQQIYQRFLQQIYQQIEKDTINEIEISTMINVNREIHHANRSLILAIKDSLLSPEEAKNFNLIPEK